MDTADPNFHATNLSVVELIIGRGIWCLVLLWSSAVGVFTAVNSLI
jgi:hypothetical protein